MGRKLVLTGTTLTDLTAPKLATIDAIESPGSIFLFDWTHPKGAAMVGVPANGAAVPNLLAVKHDALVGSPAAATVSSGSGYNGTKGLIERTAKGGLHAVVSPTLGDTALVWNILLGAATREYLRIYPAHLYYLSVWGYQTRAPVTTTGAYDGFRAEIARLSNPATMLLMTLTNIAANGRKPGAGYVGPVINSTSAAAWTGGGPPADAASMIAAPIEMPPAARWNFDTTRIRAQGGFIHYRSYLENLTVSGRTYAEVDAIDFALYTREVLTTGGRYFGDTFTAPSTIA